MAELLLLSSSYTSLWLVSNDFACSILLNCPPSQFMSLPDRRDWMFFQTLARRREYLVSLSAPRRHDSHLPVFAINLLTSLGYRENRRGKGAFEEQTVQHSAGSDSHAGSTLPPLSFAKSHTVSSRGVVIDVSKYFLPQQKQPLADCLAPHTADGRNRSIP